MRASTIAGAVIVLAGTAHAAPVASATADLDGDGTTDTVELGADGIVRFTGKLAGQVALGAPAAQGKILVAHRGGKPVVAIEIGEGAARHAVVLVHAGAWRQQLTFPVGGVGLDADYGVELAVVDDELYRYQTRAGLRRCDGLPGLLFAEKWNGTALQRVRSIPTGVPSTASVLAAKLDPTPSPPPQVFRARVASHEPGAGDAGGLGAPIEIDDGAPDTAWREELSSAGEGQFFTYETGLAAARAKQLRIVAAAKPANRPKRLGIVTAQGAWHVDLPDAANDPAGSAYVADLPEGIASCVTVVIEETYGPSTGQTQLAELEVYADGERAGGGDAMLAKVIASGGDGASGAALALARRGAAGAQALEAELAKATAPGARARIVAALVKVRDPAAGPALLRAARNKWVRGKDLLEVIDALGGLHMDAELADLAGRASVELDARIAAVYRVGTSATELPLLVDLAGKGARDLRRAVIDRLSDAPVDALIAAAQAQTLPTTTGDLWRAVTKRAASTHGGVPGSQSNAAERAAALAAERAALATATDYERRYRLIDGVATLGDDAALADLARTLAALPAGAETSALRQVAIHGASASAQAEGLKLVLSHATDADPGVRLAVLGSLGSAAADPASPWHQGTGPDGIDRVFITALSSDSWPEIRRRAAISLSARCQRPGPAAALEQALESDPVVDVRRDALTALVACRAPGIGALLAKTWDNGKAPMEVRAQAVSLAVELGDPGLAKTLVGKFSRWRGEALESEAALALAQAAAASIALLHAPGAADALSAALDDSAFPEIVAAAAQALGRLGPDCPPAAKQKLTALGDSDDQNAPIAKRAAAQCGR